MQEVSYLKRLWLDRKQLKEMAARLTDYMNNSEYESLNGDEAIRVVNELGKLMQVIEIIEARFAWATENYPEAQAEAAELDNSEVA